MADTRQTVRQAVEMLHRALVDELDGQPLEAPFELRLELPAGGATVGEGALELTAAAVVADLRAHASRLRGDHDESWPWPLGHVVDLRSERLELSQAPPDERSVLAGYEINGAPRWLNFGQWLIDQGHEEQHLLFERPPALVTVVRTGVELLADVLPAFQPGAPQLVVHGSLAAGWFILPERNGGGRPMALTFVVHSTGAPRRRRHLRLEVLGAGPRGEPLDELIPRFEEPPWQSAVVWAREVLGSVARESSKMPRAKLDARIAGVLGGLARRLRQQHRGRRRRTHHAEQRHRSGDRPTRSALRDLRHARSEELFVDKRHATLVVLGERGRAHVWSPEGKLVTSIRTTPESVERKQRAGIWRAAERREAEALRSAVDKLG